MEEGYLHGELVLTSEFLDERCTYYFRSNGGQFNYAHNLVRSDEMKCIMKDAPPRNVWEESNLHCSILTFSIQPFKFHVPGLWPEHFSV